MSCSRYERRSNSISGYLSNLTVFHAVAFAVHFHALDVSPAGSPLVLRLHLKSLASRCQPDAPPSGRIVACHPSEAAVVLRGVNFASFQPPVGT